SDPATFLKQLIATSPSFETYEITGQLRNAIVARFADAIGQAKIPVLDLAGNYDRIAQGAQQRIGPELAAMGLALTAFCIENISLPPEVEKALDTRTKMGMLGNLDQYTKFQTAEAIPEAAKNPGGLAGVGAGLGAGFAVAQQMAGALQPGTQATVAAGPPPIPGQVAFYVAVGGKQVGPLDAEALSAKVRDGSLARGTLVWKQGMASWTAAENVPELQTLLAAAPPPLPPQG